jgi:hypothetical protein
MALVALPTFALATLYGWAVFGSTAIKPGLIGLNHIALGTDWAVFWGAIRAMLDGNLPLIIDGDRFTAFLNDQLRDWLSVPLAYRPWFYPPSFLVLLLPFAPLGFIGSYVAFQIVTAGLLIAALLIGADRPDRARYIILAALLSPAAAITITDGQNAFLVAALLVAGCRALPHRPLIAGALFGILSFKPQFALLIPVALIAAGYWRALFATAASALALAAASALIFGLEIWIWWLPRLIENMLSADPKWVSYGRIWGHSVWACARLLGAGDGLASALQAAAVLFAVVITALAFRIRTEKPDLRLAVLLAATVLAAPHSGPYDALLLVVALGLWFASFTTTPGPLPWLVATAIWLVPLASPAVYIEAGRFAPLVTVLMIGLMVLDMRRPAPQAAAPA